MGFPKFKGLIKNIWQVKPAKKAVSAPRTAVPRPPLTPQLRPEEQSFIDRCSSFGLDWKTTRSEYAQRHGVSSYFDWAKVVKLPPTTALSKTPLEFQMYFQDRWENQPPEYLWANCMPRKDARANFAELETQLMQELGEGHREDVSNCLTRKWRFGVIEVALRAFPPELQRPGTVNHLHEKNPDLAFAASVSITSEFAWIYPDRTLEWIAAKLNDPKLVKRMSGHSLSSVNVLSATRRNPQVLFDALGEGEVIAWQESYDKQLGVSEKAQSVVVSREPETKLVLMHIRPGRGPGGSEIILYGAPSKDPRYPWDHRSTVFMHRKIDALDTLAKELSEFWSLPLEIQEDCDD